MSHYLQLFEAFEREQLRYVVVGGLAVVLHGHPRLTADIDLIVDLDRANALGAVNALERLGLKPRLPVDPADFADTSKRTSWIREKGMRVFSFWDPTNPMREVDLVVESPIPFSELWSRVETMSFGSVLVRVASIRDMITLKGLAGRPQDIADIQALEGIASRKQS